jgi:hypothetical protein
MGSFGIEDVEMSYPLEEVGLRVCFDTPCVVRAHLGVVETVEQDRVRGDLEVAWPAGGDELRDRRHVADDVEIGHSGKSNADLHGAPPMCP